MLVIHDIASVRRCGDTVFLLKDGGVAHAWEPKIVLTAEKIADSFDVDFETAEGSLLLTYTYIEFFFSQETSIE